MIEENRRSYIIYRIMENSVERDTGCREWIKTKNNRGYGMIHASLKCGDGYKPCIPVHRAHYMAHHNVILTRTEYVCHRCDNPSCVKIDHLFAGTPGDNARDMISKDRHSKKRAPHTRVRKFTDEQIRSIRSAVGTLKEISLAYNVSPGYVSRIKSGFSKSSVL